MPWLVLVSLVWAFSFGLIKGRLAGIDPSLVSFLRVTLALLVFLPFFRPRGLRARDTLALLAIGAVEFGIMYVAYTAAFATLAAHEVAVLTIFTPIFVCLFEDAAARRLRLWPLVAAAVATIGAGIVRPFTPGTAWGIFLVQISNVTFAAGQVAYRRWRRARPEIVDARVFALAYAGAALAALPPAAGALPDIARLTGAQWLTLLYLGAIASGACFFLWNYGAVRTAPAPLAVANNLKVPFGVAVSLWVFGEAAEPWRVLVGGGLVVAAGLLADWSERRREPPPA